MRHSMDSPHDTVWIINNQKIAPFYRKWYTLVHHEYQTEVDRWNTYKHHFDTQQQAMWTNIVYHEYIQFDPGLLLEMILTVTEMDRNIKGGGVLTRPAKSIDADVRW